MLHTLYLPGLLQMANGNSFADVVVAVAITCLQSFASFESTDEKRNKLQIENVMMYGAFYIQQLECFQKYENNHSRLKAITKYSSPSFEEYATNSDK